MVQTMVQVFRWVIRAYAGDIQRDVGAWSAAAQQITETDAYSLAPCCALVELSYLLDAPELAEQPARMLADVAERGVLFTPVWVFLVPRVLGLAATIQQAWEQAETYFQAAMAAAMRTGAQPELGQTYADYAHMLLQRNRADDWQQARTFLAQAEPICQSLGMQPCAQRLVQLTAMGNVSPPPSSQLVMRAAAGRRTPWAMP
jgi:hypothetical protein